MTAPVLDVADFMARVYPSPPCWCLVVDVYASVLGETVENYSTVSSSVRDIAAAFRLQLHKGAHGFSRLDTPADFAVVLMGKSAELGMHHAGIYYDGKVLNARDGGTLYQDLFSLADEFKLIEYWAK